LPCETRCSTRQRGGSQTGPKNESERLFADGGIGQARQLRFGNLQASSTADGAGIWRWRAKTRRDGKTHWAPSTTAPRARECGKCKDAWALDWPCIWLASPVFGNAVSAPKWVVLAGLPSAVQQAKARGSAVRGSTWWVGQKPIAARPRSSASLAPFIAASGNPCGISVNESRMSRVLHPMRLQFGPIFSEVHGLLGSGRHLS
jgi:hypothetical protein